VGCPAGATPLATSDDWAAKANAAAAGTIFCAATGTHLRARNIVPKSGQQFIAASKRGAILDGQGAAPYAFQTLAAAPAGVVLRGLVIRNYAPSTQQGAIQASNGDRWIIEDAEIDHNGYFGFVPGTNFIIRRSSIHHNRVSGADFWHAHGTLVESDTFAFNPPAAISEVGATSEAAQLKIGYSDNVTVRNNLFVDGQHKAIWFDYMNRNGRIEGNTILRHGQAGIWWEISYNAVITGNTVMTCGTRGGGWIDGAGIQVTNSPNVEIANNTISGCANGIGIMQASGYTNGPYGPNNVANLWVHDNTVTMTVGRTGIVQNDGNTAVFTSWNNRFTNNHYTLGPAAPFAWADGNRTEAQWKAYGQDVTGAFSR
jgi:parallel beta-helix repeat protein